MNTLTPISLAFINKEKEPYPQAAVDFYKHMFLRNSLRKEAL